MIPLSFVFVFSNLLILLYFVIVYYSIFRGSKNKGSMELVYVLMDWFIEGPEIIDQGSTFWML